MKISFYNPFHYISEKPKAYQGMLSLNLKDVFSVILNRRAEEALVYYKGGANRFVSYDIGEKILKFINSHSNIR